MRTPSTAITQARLSNSDTQTRTADAPLGEQRQQQILLSHTPKRAVRSQKIPHHRRIVLASTMKPVRQR